MIFRWKLLQYGDFLSMGIGQHMIPHIAVIGHLMCRVIYSLDTVGKETLSLTSFVVEEQQW